MQNDNGGSLSTVSGVTAEAQTEAEVSSPETNTQAPDFTKNLKAEMNRKFSKINEQLNTLMTHVKQSQAPIQSAPVEETEIAPDLNKQVDARLAEQAHRTHFNKALDQFPELNEQGDDFDPKFYQLVDSFYTKFRKADPTDVDAFQNALELAANKSGKNQRLIQDKILADEARRSRIIAEGGAVPKEQRKEKEPEINLKALSKLGIKDPEKLKARIKQYQQRGED